MTIAESLSKALENIAEIDGLKMFAVNVQDIEVYTFQDGSQIMIDGNANIIIPENKFKIYRKDTRIAYADNNEPDEVKQLYK